MRVEICPSKSENVILPIAMSIHSFSPLKLQIAKAYSTITKVLVKLTTTHIKCIYKNKIYWP